ncbi:MAG: glycosyltransferase family 2 protein [Deltaproteobacteria bacterium]|nr:glycosyltransferase family 2 protein [Deltaproteobacteria bacterium]
MSGPAQPPPGTRPGLSLAMIVKDEERLLPRALASARPWVDEIVVVDTGSTDRTPEIAREFGARVYSHPWQQDFALHRNQSFSYATEPWIFYLDADEELDQASGPLLHRVISQAAAEINCVLVDLYNLLPGGGQELVRLPRVFRRTPDLHFVGRVHNQPVYQGQPLLAPIRLYHYGYGLDEATMAAKHRRRLEMISRWVAAEPENWRARYHWAQTLVSRPESTSEAIEAGEQALELALAAEANSRDVSYLYLVLLQALERDPARHAETCRYAEAWQRLTPFHPDPWFYLAWSWFRQRDWPRVSQAAAVYCRLLAEAPTREEMVNFNLFTAEQLFRVLSLWTLAEAAQEREPEALAVFERTFRLPRAEEIGWGLVLSARELGLARLPALLARRAARAHPSWAWPQSVLAGGPGPGPA